ncbi:glycosyltransferase family 39 protein [Propionibacterium australiense]|uniref:ABC transporter n=1 Tax=Propionibacterium australiense TaxID=119981 RepID=A0A383S5F6_9ACTN|nr:glycosyltransferase family 39 protein [Propionibacterium australiense]RLP07033.1 ABC transporter [Propionibacterium australiense]RLP07069.1 ABC transporter [Propionibacterium australiense]SYZ33147.1 Dolichyl-phosphate-mannose-protein mannosyltransferase [Propionibacterium australiense]VEH89163.1 Uncharacterised protein [Propionibacterium australiense]
MSRAALTAGTGIEAGTTPARALSRRGERRPELLVGLAALVGYLVVALWLSAHDLVFPDAMSRVANGYYVLFSRDPHLAAVGFVWNPLPSLAVIPLLLLSPLCPALAGDALAGCLVSALCGALAVALLYRLLGQLGAGLAARLSLTALFALHPLVLLSSAVGASEAMLLAVGLYVAVHLTEWLTEGDPWQLVHVGVGAGVAYLVRYEALAIGAAIALLVLVVSWARWRGRERALGMAIVDMTLAVGPVVVAFALWALASRIIVGSWLETFTSQYGNSAQVGTFRESIDGIVGTGQYARLAYLAEQLARTAPLAIPLALVALVVALRRRETGFLSPFFVLGSVLAFQNLTFLRGMSFGWLRFQITAVPLGVLAAGYLVAVVHHAAGSPALRRAGSTALVAAVAAALPLAWWTETDPRFAREEALAVEVAEAGQYPMEQQVAEDIAAMGLPEGAVITDVAYSFPIVLAAQEPRVYAITTDQDFKQLLAEPRGNGVGYALLTSPDTAPADAIEEQYPGMWENGAGAATMVRQWRDGRGLTWRLYRFDA